jgi:hypothetical protein
LAIAAPSTASPSGGSSGTSDETGGGSSEMCAHIIAT